MKQARQIEIPDDRGLTPEEYEDFRSHAEKSSMWYASNYSRNSNQIRQKLYDKGYPVEDVEIELSDGSKDYKNIVEDTVAMMIEMLLIDDRQYATSIINAQMWGGFGIEKLRSTLSSKGVDSELADELLETLDLEEKNRDALEKAAQRVVRTSAFLKLDVGWPRQQKLTQQLVSKGFSFSEISEWKEENQEAMGEEY